MKRFALAFIICACGGKVTTVVDGGLDAAVVIDAAPDVDAAPQCSWPKRFCNGDCVANDADHCGAACTPCTTTIAFAHGVCEKGTQCGTACDVMECSGVCTSPSDANNCGACGRSCGAQVCQSSACTPEIIATAHVFGFAVDDVNVYYTDLGGMLWMAPAGGGTSTSLGVTFAGSGVAVDASYVYWDTNSYGLDRMPLGGGAITELASVGVSNFVLADTAIYGGVAAQIWQLPIDGGSVQPFASTIHFTTLTPDATDLYACGEGIVRLSRADVTATTLLASTESVDAAAADATTLFYAQYDTSSYSIYSMPKAPPNTPVWLASATSVSSMAVDATNIYFINGSTVARVAKTGGAVVTLSVGSSPIRELAINSTYVYFNDIFTLMRTPK